MTLRVHYLQNLDRAGIGNASEWAKSQGYSLTGTALYNGESLPELNSFDILIVLGGVPADCKAWLDDEIRFIRQAIDSKKGVLGICLGSQLIACAMGGELIPHTHAENGWHQVVFKQTAASHPLLAGLDSRPLFFFHRNTVVLPDLFTLHASTEGCPNQIFTCSDRVIGIQAHPEMLPTTISQLANEQLNELPQGPYTLLNSSDAANEANLEGAAQLLAGVLNNMATVLSRDA